MKLQPNRDHQPIPTDETGEVTYEGPPVAKCIQEWVDKFPNDQARMFDGQHRYLTFRAGQTRTEGGQRQFRRIRVSFELSKWENIKEHESFAPSANLS